MTCPRSFCGLVAGLRLEPNPPGSKFILVRKNLEAERTHKMSSLTLLVAGDDGWGSPGWERGTRPPTNWHGFMWAPKLEAGF